MKRAGDKQSEMSAEMNRLGHDGETIAGRAMPDPPADATDSAVLWGRRIGRTLGWLAAAFLLYQLYLAYGS